MTPGGDGRAVRFFIGRNALTTAVRTCSKGHSDFYFPPDGSTGSPYCRTCKRENRGLDRVPCTHDDGCEPTVNRRGHRYCRAQARHCQRLARAQGASRPTRPERRAAAKMVQRPDGLEAVYGPVPQRVPDRAWVDRVALELHLRGKRVGRNLTIGERRALALLKALRHPPGR